MGFRENLKDELVYQDLQTKELSNRTNISLNTLNHYLKNNSASPSVENAVKIANALGVSVEYLTTGKTSHIENPIPERILQLSLKMRNLKNSDLDLIENFVKRLSER